MNEETRERAIDALVQERLATDRAYRNAENADEQAAREREVEEQVVAELDARAAFRSRMFQALR